MEPTLIKWLKKLNRRQLFGVILLTLSTLAWTVVLFVPFFSFEANTKVAIAATLIVFGEVTGYSGLALLGKEAVDAMKERWQKLKARFSMGGEGGDRD